MSRHHDRQRSRDRHGYRGRSQSSDSYEKKKRSYHRSPHQTNPEPPASRRVNASSTLLFNDVPDIKVFKKEDEPNSKGLTQADLEEFMKKMEAEKGTGSFNNMNWEKMKHMDAQLQSNSIKEQKEKERILNEKLQAVKEEMPFYIPIPLKKSIVTETGQESTERVGLAARLNDVLGCFYAQQSQIPSEPSFQIQNKSTALQPKLINFDKLKIEDLPNPKKNQKKDQKPLKGILKITPQERRRERAMSEPHKVDMTLINLLKEMQINKAAYPKQKAEMILRPYKQSGQLDYLKNNPAILSSLMRSSSVPTEIPKPNLSPSGGTLPDPYKVRYSVSPQPEKPPVMTNPSIFQPQPMQADASKALGQPAGYNQYRPVQGGNYMQYPMYQNPMQQPQGQPPNMNYNPMGYGQPQNFNTQPQPSAVSGISQQTGYPAYQPQQPSNPMYNANRNFKTVPCKYFHSPQGCVKANNCTFIHDEEYAGKPTPSMLKSNRGMVMTSYGPGDTGGAMGGNFYPPFPNGPYEGQN